MSEITRLYRYKTLLSGRRAKTAAELQADLEISPATFKRDIAKLRDQLHVPIVFDRDAGGYRMEQGHTDSELPGLWFSQEEVLALVTIQHLLSQLEPGLLGNKLKPLQDRLAQLMDQYGLGAQDVARRIRIVHAGKRRLSLKSFEIVAAATMGRKRLKITHFNRQNGERVVREISPQRLVHYRDNWYVDAWCHLRDEIRSFAIDAIETALLLGTEATEVSDERIDAVMGAGYGIFSGPQADWASLRFSPKRARWVAGEAWHPQQEGRMDPDGSYVLSLPYSDDRELVGDILRYGADVQVLHPPALKTRVHRALLEAVGRYV